MKTQPVTVVRIYVRESEHLLDKLVKFLHDERAVAGVTVLRGIEGFSGSGDVHPAFLLGLSLDLPLVIEFFDEPQRIEAVIHSLVRRFPLQHIVSWPAISYLPQA
jgi:PII-like signaling protein